MIEELTDRLEESDWTVILCTAVFAALPLLIVIALAAQRFLAGTP